MASERYTSTMRISFANPLVSQGGTTPKSPKSTGILPSPPLSPQQDLVFGHHLNTSSLSIAASLPLKQKHDTSKTHPHDLPDSTTPLSQSYPPPISTTQDTMTKITVLDNIVTDSSKCMDTDDSPASPASPLPTSSFTTTSSAFSSAVDADVPILPSELRKRHEKLKRQKYDEEQQQLQLKEQPSDHNDHHSLLESIQERGSHEPPLSKYKLAQSPIESKGPIEQDGHDSQNKMDYSDRQDTPHPVSYHSSGVVRAKSYSMFESSSSGSMWNHSERDIVRREYGGNNIARNSMGLPEMPTRDWVKMQARVNTLEQEVSHASRTNLLLNQELDKVNGHLRRLTSESGEGWRREYEFLVQQVDLMHRQLQMAYSETRSGGQQGGGNHSRRGSTIGQAEITRELHAEVKELTASLQTWQAAFQQAEENYRRKCDGERELKQTLRERESQLSSLVEKLTGYESEFQKSITYYEELMRLSSELEALDGRGDGPIALALENGTSDSQPPANVDKQMPGHFPDRSSEQHPVTNIDQLSVSILSWAALLATYILS